MKLVLFDIDGTLLHCRGRTREPLAEALEQTCGTAGSLREDGFAGKTDDQIVFAALTSAGLSEARILASLPEIKNRYFEILEQRVDAESVTLLPGVVETLERLAANSGVGLGLLTGNWRRGADWKLARVGLNGRFSIGAFGDGKRDRVELLPVALESARSHFDRELTAADVLIVGDTPNDVRCGRHHGAAVVALTTGYASRQELIDAGADWVCDSLPDAGYLEPMVDQQSAGLGD